MNSFSIPADNFDFELTVTCGQTFCWHRFDGELYGDGGSKFYTFRDGELIVVDEMEDEILVKTGLSREEAEHALGVSHDLDTVFESFPSDEPLETAMKEFWGLRVLQDEFFPCLISYLCSPQMQIPRIKKMHDEIARKYGETVEFNGETLLKFPTPEQLSTATEEDLRELGVGYRAKYIVETVKMINDGFEPPRDMEYEDAREKMKELYGVGDKVADCVLLFSLGYHEASPLDTWGRKVLESHYPELHADKYDEASENMRSWFGDYAGYAQEYLFHAARTGVLETE